MSDEDDAETAFERRLVSERNNYRNAFKAEANRTASLEKQVPDLERELQAWRDGALRVMRQGLTLAGPTTPAEFLVEVEAKLRVAADDRRHVGQLEAAEAARAVEG